MAPVNLLDKFKTFFFIEIPETTVSAGTVSVLILPLVVSILKVLFLASTKVIEPAPIFKITSIPFVILV